MNPQLINPLKVSEIIGVSIGTLAVWRSTGRYALPFIKIGSKVMYRLSDVNAFIEQRMFAHTGEF